MSNIEIDNKFRKYKSLAEIKWNLDLSELEVTYLENLLIDHNLDFIMYDQDSRVVIVPPTIPEEDVELSKTLTIKLRHAWAKSKTSD